MLAVCVAVSGEPFIAPPPRRLDERTMVAGREVGQVEVLKVSGASVPKSVAGAIAQVLRREPRVTMQAVGPDAVNQAVKSIAIARSYLEGDGLDLVALPSFEKIEIEGLQRTAIRFLLERRDRTPSE